MCNECAEFEKEYLKMNFVDPHKEMIFYVNGETLEQAFILKREYSEDKQDPIISEIKNEALAKQMKPIFDDYNERNK
jgi:hypothetical protein